MSHRYLGHHSFLRRTRKFINYNCDILTTTLRNQQDCAVLAFSNWLTSFTVKTTVNYTQYLRRLTAVDLPTLMNVCIENHSPARKPLLASTLLNTKAEQPILTVNPASSIQSHIQVSNEKIHAYALSRNLHRLPSHT